MSNGNADATSATAKTNSPMARASGGKTSHRPAHEKRGKVRARSPAPQAPATAVPTADCRAHAGAPARAKISRTVRVRETGFLLRPIVAPTPRVRRICPSRYHAPDPTGHARMDGSQPIRHAIESNQLVNFKARAYQRPFVALDQHFRHQGPRVVGTGLDRAIGAADITASNAPFAGSIISRFTARKSPLSHTGPTTSARMRRPGRLFRHGPNLVVRVI